MARKLIANPSGETIQTSKDESGTDDELARQQRNSEKQLVSEQYSLRYVKAEENAFATSIGADRIATKAHKTGDGGIIVAPQRSGSEVTRSSPDQTSKRTTQRFTAGLECP